MRHHPFLSAALTALLVTVGACKSLPTGVTEDGADSSEASAAAENEKAPDKGGDAAAAAEAKAGKKKGGDDAAKAASGDGKKDDDDDQAKKDEAQKKWDKALEDLEKATGLFTTHHGEQKLLLELDEAAVGREFLYWAQLNSGLGSGAIYRGAMLYDSPFVVRFEKRGEKKVVLLSENTQYFEGEDALEQRVLDEVTSDGLVAAFDIVAELEDEDRVLIDLGSWFLSDNLKLARGMGGKASVNRDLSLFTEIKSFPRNVEIYQELAVMNGNGSPFANNSTMADGRGAFLDVQHSMVAMPPDGYKPREFDQRVGYFYTERKNLFDRQSKDPVTRYINRWRLQKKDPTAEVSDPVKPIVYWIENSTPKAFREAVKKGIEAWEPAFRKAGFSNAIVAKQMPDDAEWDPADVRYAVVRWSDDENVGFAIGPSRQNPRTGETIDADITMQANFINIYAQRFDNWIANQMSMTKDQIRMEYEASKERRKAEQADPRQRFQCDLMSDERAFQLATALMVVPELSDEAKRQEFLKAMITEVTAHEVGHTLGMRHNFKASTWLDMEGVADGATTGTQGLTGSFMDYMAVNIAAPGEEQGEYFMSAIGPYDYWTIEYGYREFGNNEGPQLEKIAALSHEPGKDFATDEDRFYGDVFSRVWDLSDDPIAFAEAQVKLGEWGMDNLAEKGAEDGEGYHEYTRYYGMFLRLLNSHQGLADFIGGYTLNRDVVGQDGGRDPIVPVDPDMQRRALDLMVNKGLRWSGGIPDEQRILLANKKYGSFGSWFDFWSFDPLARIVNSTRFWTLIYLTDPSLYERLANQERFIEDGGLSIHEVRDAVFTAVWPDDPDEHDLWSQADYVDMVMNGIRWDTTPVVTALYDRMLRDAESKLESYAGSGDETVANHGAWLGDKIRRWRERQKVEF